MNNDMDMLLEMKHKCVSGKYIQLTNEDIIGLWKQFGEWLYINKISPTGNDSFNYLEKSVFWDIVWTVAKTFNYTKQQN